MQQRHREGPGEPAPSGIPSWEEVGQRAYRLLQSRFARDKQPADWEDMAHDVVCKVIVALAKGAVDVSRFDAWFYTVVERVAYDRDRKDFGRPRTRVFEPLPDDHASTTSARVEEERDSRLDVQGLLARTELSDHERFVVQGTYWYDLTSAGIADVFGVAAPTVRGWRRDALNKLRAHAQEALPELDDESEESEEGNER